MSVMCVTHGEGWGLNILRQSFKSIRWKKKKAFAVWDGKKGTHKRLGKEPNRTACGAMHVNQEFWYKISNGGT